MYRRLPGRSLAFTGYHRLYQGPDHLLLASETGFSERYKRFFFRDVQAMVLRESKAQWVWNAIWGGLLLLCLAVWALALGLSSSVEVGWLVFGGIMTALVAAPLAVNVLLGPTCHCYVVTAVQTERLPCLKRLKTAERLLQAIEPLIDSAQGAFSEQDLALLSAPPPDPARETPSAVPPRIHEAGLRADSGRLHRWLVGFLLADLPFTTLVFLAPSWGYVVGTLLFSATAILAIVVAARQRGTNLPGTLRALPWLTLALLAAHQISAVAYAVFAGAQGRPGLLMGMLAMEDPMVRGMSVVSTVLSLLLGVFGMVNLRGWPPGPGAPPRPPGSAPQTPP